MTLFSVDFSQTRQPPPPPPDSRTLADWPPSIIQPLSTCYCTKAETTGRETRKGNDYNSARLIRMILCVLGYWLVWGAYRSKWATGGSHGVEGRGRGGSSLTGCSIRFAATDKLTIDRYAHRPSIWHCRDSGVQSLPLTWNRNRNDGVSLYMFHVSDHRSLKLNIFKACFFPNNGQP